MPGALKISWDETVMPILDDIIGRHDGELAVLLRLGERRFGSVPSPARDRLAKMSVSEVEPAALRLLDARSVEEPPGLKLLSVRHETTFPNAPSRAGTREGDGRVTALNA